MMNSSASMSIAQSMRRNAHAPCELPLSSFWIGTKKNKALAPTYHSEANALNTTRESLRQIHYSTAAFLLQEIRSLT